MKMQTQTQVAHMTFALLVIAVASSAYAGAGGAEFAGVLSTVSDWFQGTLGKIIALTTFGVGMAVGIVKQSLMAAVTGVASGITLNYGPDVIDSMFSAALPLIT